MKAILTWAVKHPVPFIVINIWLAVWSANVVTTWAQTVLIQGDNDTKAAASLERSKANRHLICVLIAYDKISEQACARR